ncbi:hypothetical protein BMR07_05520 [Methylococcaceae bacterium CS1]|nr:hypothetical protein BMR07_05520 [Methylococcaceae bacterium CS1]
MDQDMAIILCPEKDTPQWGECLYEVGGTGPAGGLVFYATDGGRHGIEASPTDQGQSEWGCYNTEFEGVTGTAIGSGAANTKIISESNCVGRYSYSGEIAARVSNNYELNGFDDWYLPSRDELYLMNKDLIAKDLGGFKGRSYWSSSNYTISSRPDEFAWIQSFGGDNYGVSRFGELSVRSIRSF